jgi:hypothetical protein
LRGGRDTSGSCSSMPRKTRSSTSGPPCAAWLKSFFRLGACGYPAQYPIPPEREGFRRVEAEEQAVRPARECSTSAAWMGNRVTLVLQGRDDFVVERFQGGNFEHQLGIDG